jgi:hypothetical protein
VHRRYPVAQCGDAVVDRDLEASGGGLGHAGLGKRFADGSHLHDVEQLFRPVRGEYCGRSSADAGSACCACPVPSRRSPLRKG